MLFCIHLFISAFKNCNFDFKTNNLQLKFFLGVNNITFIYYNYKPNNLIIIY